MIDSMDDPSVRSLTLLMLEDTKACQRENPLALPLQHPEEQGLCRSLDFVCASVAQTTTLLARQTYCTGAHRSTIARAVRNPSIAAVTMPPAYPAPSPTG